MLDLLKFWMLLFPAFALGRLFLAGVGFNHIDLRFENFAVLVVTPLVQAGGLAWLQSENPWRSLGDLGRAVWSRRRCRTALIVDISILAAVSSAALAMPGQAGAGLGLYNSLKALLAAVLAGRLGFRARSRGAMSWSLFLLGGGLAGAGLQEWWPWPERLSELFFSGWPRLFRWAFVYAPLLVFFGIVLILLVRQLRPSHPSTAGLLEAAFAPALAALTILVLAFFNRPFLSSPWLETALTLKSLVISLFLLGLLSLRLRGGPPVSPQTGPNQSRVEVEEVEGDHLPDLGC